MKNYLRPLAGVFALVSAATTTTAFAAESSPLVVAVVDSGVDVEHRLLASHIWSNPGESGLDKNGQDKSTNGIDDDGNGFIDDLHGWNFSGNNKDLRDQNGHGTHVAGIIVQGAPAARIMAVKYFDPKASGEKNLNDTVRAFQYAIRMKADIINYSGGGRSPSPEEKAAMATAARAGILVVAAAGNESRRLASGGFFPATYDLPNIAAVAADKAGDRLIQASNFSATKVHFSAPGFEIRSALPGNRFGTMTGTSQATAFVTAAAVKLLDQQPHLRGHPAELIQHLGNTGTLADFLAGKTIYGTRLNTKQAVAIAEQSSDAFGHYMNPRQSLADSTFLVEGPDAPGTGPSRTFLPH